MAFLIRTDKHGLHYIERNSNATERWPQHTAHYERWESVPLGTRILVTDVFRPPHLPPISYPRADGLHEVVLARMKPHRYTMGYGVHQTSHEDLVPVFIVPGDPKKRHARAFGNFAFADDAASVATLIQFQARNRAETAIAELFTSYAKGMKKELERARVDAARQERQRMLAERAAAVGVTADELAEAIKVWDAIRRHKYGANKCMVCGRVLTDPPSIVRGIGPECLKYFPAIKAAARARVLNIGHMRYDGERLIERFKRAGATEIVQALEESRFVEELSDAAAAKSETR
jgi:hypothetical protein